MRDELEGLARPPGALAPLSTVRRLATAVAAPAATWLLAPVVFDGGSSASVILAAAFGLVASGMVCDAGKGRTSLLAGGAALTAVLWAVDLDAWARAAWAMLAAAVLGRSATGRGPGTGMLWAVGLGVGAPSLLTAALLVLGGDGATVLRSQLVRAHTGSALAAGGALLAPTAWLVLWSTAAGTNPPAPPAPPSRAVARLFLALGAALLLFRGVWILSYATLPTDMVVWSEPPILLNLLKLRVGAIFYGPPAEAGSYSYSPGLELVHRAVLGPFGLDLSLVANRALGLAAQLASATTLTWALWRRAPSRPVAALIGGAAVLSSFLAPFIHPDHLLMLCFAAAVAIVVAEDRMRRGVFLALLFCVPVAATAFKLTGAGIGVGLVAVYATARRWREVGVLCLSAIAAIATIPLFDATLGRFSWYAIGLQSSHTIRWRAAAGILTTAEGRIGLLALATLSWGLARWQRTETGRLAARVALLTAGAMSTSLLGYLKHGGRTNSLLPLVVGSAVVLVLVCGWRTGARPQRPGGTAVAAALAAWMGAALLSPKPAALGASRRALMHAHHWVVRHLTTELTAGGHPLLYSGTAAWIEAGGRGVPIDRVQSATELSLAQSPYLRNHLERLAAGEYTTIVTAQSVLRRGDTPEGRLARQIEHAILRSYDRDESAPEGLALFRRHRAP